MDPAFRFLSASTNFWLLWLEWGASLSCCSSCWSVAGWSPTSSWSWRRRRHRVERTWEQLSFRRRDNSRRNGDPRTEAQSETEVSLINGCTNFGRMSSFVLNSQYLKSITLKNELGISSYWLNIKSCFFPCYKSKYDFPTTIC
jgi:hypothetical protein